MTTANWPLIRAMEREVWGHSWTDHGPWRSRATAVSDPGDWHPCKCAGDMPNHIGSAHGHWTSEGSYTWCIACQAMVPYSTWGAHYEHSQQAHHGRA